MFAVILVYDTFDAQTYYFLREYPIKFYLSNDKLHIY